MGNGPVFWHTPKSRTVALSSSEAEGYALGNLTREIIWVNTLLNDLKVSVLPIHVFDDSQNVLAWIRDKAIRARTRHIGVQLNFVREAEQDGTIVLDWVPGTEQIADCLTKPLARLLFEKFYKSMGCQMIKQN